MTSTTVYVRIPFDVAASAQLTCLVRKAERMQQARELRRYASQEVHGDTYATARRKRYREMAIAAIQEARRARDTAHGIKLLEVCDVS